MLGFLSAHSDARPGSLFRLLRGGPRDRREGDHLTKKNRPGEGKGLEPTCKGFLGWQSTAGGGGEGPDMSQVSSARQGKDPGDPHAGFFSARSDAHPPPPPTPSLS